MQLRDYQIAAIKSIWDYYSKGNHGNPIVAMPMGTGKSIVIAGFIKSVLEIFPFQKILVVTHVKELIEQDYSKLLELWPQAPAGIYSSGLKRRDTDCNIIFAGIASVSKKAVLFGKVDLVLIDEAHLVSTVSSTMYRSFLADLIKVNANLKIIGFTATAFRLQQGCLTAEGGLFTDICYDLTKMNDFNWLIDQGYLSPIVPKKTKLQLNIDKVRVQAGDYVSKDLQKAIDKYEITSKAMREVIELSGDRKSWLIFTTGIEHSVHTAEILNDLGVPSRAVHSSNKFYTMGDSERTKNIEDFKQGKFTALVNSNIVTTGFDHSLIDLIADLRPTQSPGLRMQMLGRGIRPVYATGFDLRTKNGRLSAISCGPKKNCIVFDFADNTRRLGPINDPVIPNRNRKGKRKGTAPVKLCEAQYADGNVCNTWVHASLRHCPECGNEFKFSVKISETSGTEKLIRENLPEINCYKVDRVIYNKHVKPNIPSIRVTYFCNIKKFTEYVCIEHSSAIKFRAQKWWKDRTSCPVPNTVKDAFLKIDKLKTPLKIKVWENKQWPEIISYVWE